MVAAHHLTYRAGGRALVDDVSATFEPGRLHLIVGPNGAGKSTFVRLLARLIRPHEGQVTYDGADVRGAAERVLARRRAVLSQAVEIAFPLTVREVVMMGRYPHFGGRAAPVDEDICDAVMAYFDVTDLGNRSYPTLSGGEKQRVNFARVLAQVWRPAGAGARILFLDEPLTFLDISHQLDFMRKVTSFTAAPDVVAIGVVHDLGLAARFADHILMIDEGRLVASGPAASVLTRDHIRAVFDVDPIFLPDPQGRGTHLVYE
ncbi:MAG: heme ABC transporter ATP-binding protein [Vicinamibacterales bacterium]